MQARHTGSTRGLVRAKEDWSVQRFDIKLIFVIAQAALKPGLYMALLIADSAQNKRLTAPAAPDVHLDALV